MAIGIEPEKHDIRLVEDDWESPMLGAWGLGWEVWLDGMEINSPTFEQVRGLGFCKTQGVEVGDLRCARPMGGRAEGPPRW